MTALSGGARPGDDCYKHIGVYGDGSCPKLAEYVHCRNCPVFAASAQLLLDRELPADYRAAWSGQYSRLRTESPVELSTVLVFRVGEEWMALPAQVLEEVGTARRVHSLPHRRDGVILGVANFRGELVTCVSLARVLGVHVAAHPAATPSAHTYARMLVLNRAGSRFITPVEEVRGLRRFSAAEMLPPPATLGKAARTFTAGVLRGEQQSIGCLDDELLFHFIERSLA